MSNISSEFKIINNSRYGEDIRDPLYSIVNKINSDLDYKLDNFVDNLTPSALSDANAATYNSTVMENYNATLLTELQSLDNAMIIISNNTMNDERTIGDTVKSSSDTLINGIRYYEGICYTFGPDTKLLAIGQSIDIDALFDAMTAKYPGWF